ncbi:hypothetical protein EJV46_03295 [Roseococcus sp. SYP-B2431]|uniref:hypothetical protein n=1 Tax=Roseococcus sp. SYP-B2431 TaxID=2496640 RepID=UPI00103A0640|nr:hypothetical protein [Roseococcus sp. SYP-B2431]TCH99714.1 hypothetical protein EJV46_03295 [Roseococcus sp. SYP-B2431]
MPTEVRAAIATGLCHVGSVIFLGGSHWSKSNVWHRVDGGWAGISRKFLSGFLRRRNLKFTTSRQVEIVETLFDQQGFDWNLRGQLAFVLEGRDTNIPPIALPDSFAACLEADPPRCAPQGCIAILRPGTDGDFAEFHAASQKFMETFQNCFSVPGTQEFAVKKGPN